MFSSNDPNQPDDQRLVKAALDCFNDSASCEAFARICARLKELDDAVVEVTKEHGSMCLCAGCEAMRPF